MWRIAWIPLLLARASAAQTLSYPPDENPRYFPAGVFADAPRDDGDLKDRWFAVQLRGLGEPSLLVDAPNSEPVYRFTWLRSFHHPVSVRMRVHADGGAALSVRMGDGEGGYAPGKLMVNSTREIQVREVRRALDLLDEAKFWSAPAELRFDEVNLDGAQWIFEASVAGKYHVIDRWSPKRGPVRELGLYLVNVLGNLRVPAKEVY